MSSQKRGRNRPKLGSVDAFWADHPRIHMAKKVFDTSIEAAMLVLAVMNYREDRDKICEYAAWNETFDTERERLSVGLMCFIHALHICRLLFTCCA